MCSLEETEVFLTVLKAECPMTGLVSYAQLSTKN